MCHGLQALIPLANVEFINPETNFLDLIPRKFFLNLNYESHFMQHTLTEYKLVTVDGVSTPTPGVRAPTLQEIPVFSFDADGGTDEVVGSMMIFNSPMGEKFLFERRVVKLDESHEES